MKQRDLDKKICYFYFQKAIEKNESKMVVPHIFFQKSAIKKTQKLSLEGARSPIHNHGAVCAVIKVLYGTIQSGVYNKVNKDKTYFLILFK